MVKIIHTFIIVFFVLFSACTQTQEEIQETPIQVEEVEEKKTIVAFGDSLTEGLGVDKSDAYPAQLESYLISKGYTEYKVINSGSSGETSTGAKSRIDWVLSFKPDIIIVEFGANDAFRGIDVEIIENNIDEILARIKQDNVTIILAGIPAMQNLGEDYVNQFEAIYPKLAQKHDVLYIENFLEGVVANSDLNQEDEIHPTKEGYKLIVENNIFPILEQVLEK